MKNRNKYTNLASGMAFWALNSGSILFTLLSLYGLFMIRDFSVKENDQKLRLMSETLMGLALTRGIVGIFALYQPSALLPYVSIFINVVVFALSIVVLKSSLIYLMKKLGDYELVNLKNKVKQSYFTILAMDGILVVFLLLILFTSFFPITILLNFISLFLNPTFNTSFTLALTFIKYFASRAFSNSAIMLNNAAQLEERV